MFPQHGCLNFFHLKKFPQIYLFIGLSVLFLTLLAKPILLLSLSVYEKYITPYNGCCAYRVINGGEFCSEVFERILRSDGIIPAVMAMPEQFSKCNAAFHEYQRRIQNGDTIPACCVAAACCADIATTPVPINNN